MKTIVTIILFLVCLLSSQLSAKELDAKYDYKIYECKVKENEVTEIVKIKITIYNQRGDYLNRMFFDRSPFEYLDKVKCEVFNSKGEKVYTKKLKDMTKFEGFGGSVELYSDSKVYTTELRGPGYPYSIEYEFRKKYKSLFFWRGADILESVPVYLFKYSLTIDKDITFDYRTPDIIEKPTIEDKGSKLNYIWSADSLPKLETESMEFSKNQLTELKIVAHSLSLKKYEYNGPSWKNIGLWYNKLAEEKYLKNQVQIPKDAAPIEYIKDVYENVITSNRYVAVSMGISGWQPADASVTKKCGYGDCKGLSTLLISEIKCDEIKAYPVLILTRNYGVIDPEFPEFGFNHLIVMAIVDKDTLWMDPTCDNCPFGEIPWQDEDTYVVVVTDTGGVVVKTPISKPSQNNIRIHTNYSIASSNYAELNSTISIIGNSAQRLRYYLSKMDKDQIADMINEIFPLTSKNFSGVEQGFENETDINQPLIIRIKGISEKPILTMGSESFVQIPYLNIPVYKNIKEINDKVYSIDFTYPKSVVEHINIEWLDTQLADSIVIPSDTSLQFEYGNVNVQFKIIDNKIEIDSEKYIHVYLMDDKEIDSYRTYLQSVKGIFNKRIILHSSSK